MEKSRERRVTRNGARTFIVVQGHGPVRLSWQSRVEVILVQRMLGHKRGRRDEAGQAE